MTASIFLRRGSALLLVGALAACGDDSGTGGNATTASTGAGPGSSVASGSGSTNAASTSAGNTSASGSGNASSSTGGGTMMNFFVTSDNAPTGNFGGLAGADARCQALATAVGEGGKTWRAYLSTEDPVVNARDRIGPGPYYNAAGAMVAADKDELHALMGNADLFLTETGDKVNGQWDGSPDPNEHDIVTGSTVEGMVDEDFTCGDWTADNGDMRVGHSDGLGPGGSMMPMYVSWNSSHDQPCDDPESTGGAAKIYCFTEN